MNYKVQFGILSWNNLISGTTAEETRNDLEDFFYTMNINYKAEESWYYSFILSDGSKHMARIYCDEQLT